MVLYKSTITKEDKMKATEILTLDVSRELALKRITDSRVNRFNGGEKLIFNNVDVTLTRNGTDVTKDYNLSLEYFDEENTLSLKCSSQERKDNYDVVYFYIKGDDAISITKGNEHKATKHISAVRDSEEDQEFCLTIKAV